MSTITTQTHNSITTAYELESQTGPSYPTHSDPLKLSSRLKSSTDIQNIRSSISRRNSLVGSLKLNKDASKARQVRHFYKEQNDNIERFLKPVQEHRRLAREESDSNAFQYKFAVRASFAANICLAALQVFAAVYSGSLSLFTTMADALFDPLSNLTLILCNRAVKRVDGRMYPQGKARIETAGNIAFCFLMFAVSLVLLVVSARELAEGNAGRNVSEFHLPSIIAVAVAFMTKLCLFLYCYALRNKYSQIRILWEDHRNDLVINGVGLCTSILGSKVYWAIDPAGAIGLAVLIAALWLYTAWSEAKLLIGVTAETPMLQHITYIGVYLRPPNAPRFSALTSCCSHDTFPRSGRLGHNKGLALRTSPYCGS